MQKFRVDISSRGAPMVLYAAQGDTKSRFFSVAMFDSGVAYSLPSGAYVTVRFGAPGMPAGWYDIIQEPGGGSHPAVSAEGNVITAELAEQAVSVQGKNGVWLLVNAADGYQLASWGFDLFVEAVHGLDAPEATVYYNALTEQVAKTLANAQAAAASAAQAQQYAESINTSQFATSAQGAKADTAVQSVNGQRGTDVTLTPATIGAANASDVLTYEEIQASTDLTGKIASASSVVHLMDRTIIRSLETTVGTPNGWYKIGEYTGSAWNVANILLVTNGSIYVCKYGYDLAANSYDIRADGRTSIHAITSPYSSNSIGWKAVDGVLYLYNKLGSYTFSSILTAAVESESMTLYDKPIYDSSVTSVNDLDFYI